MEVFAHRGVSALYPENSQTAISACKDAAYLGIEIDLFQAQEQFFVVHDSWLSRLFGIDKKITESTDEEIAALVCSDGKAIPTLEWLIAELAGQELMLNIELKGIKDIELFVSQLTDLISRYNFNEENLLISSFNHPYLVQINNAKPNWKLGLLIAHEPIDIKPYLTCLPLYSLHLSNHAWSEKLLSELNQFPVKSFVYTVDQEQDITLLLNHQVDGIFANNPERAHKIINKLI